ncbi:hypothetical protein [Polaromonas sp.]|uniref:hypothetical protein n=1 Tax=Polaromonas sp. TaxID=1869339 RepID=UPI0017CE7415|nr:hypothetical protein [Polaromonas sp.]NML84892.1 hypothetical protein [Polaromonas sp.]
MRWYLDYGCRDDCGAGLTSVSAWAGIDDIACRHGVRALATEPSAGRDARVLTCPRGNR